MTLNAIVNSNTDSLRVSSVGPSQPNRENPLGDMKREGRKGGRIYLELYRECECNTGGEAEKDDNADFCQGERVSWLGWRYLLNDSSVCNRN